MIHKHDWDVLLAELLIKLLVEQLEAYRGRSTRLISKTVKGGSEILIRVVLQASIRVKLYSYKSKVITRDADLIKIKEEGTKEGDHLVSRIKRFYRVMAVTWSKILAGISFGNGPDLIHLGTLIVVMISINSELLTDLDLPIFVLNFVLLVGV